MHLSTAAETIWVPHDYPTIQEAVKAASHDSVILVSDGTYNECVNINKPLSLISVNRGAIIRGANIQGILNIDANNVTVFGFTIEGMQNSGAGIYIEGLFCNITGNTLKNNYRGVYMYDSGYNTLRGNNLTNNTYNFAVWGRELSHFIHDIDSSNTVNGKPIYYLVDRHNEEVPPGAGFVGIVNCSNITVKDQVLENNEEGVLLAYSKYCTIINITVSNNVRSIFLVCSNNNVVNENRIFSNKDRGICLHDSCDNTFNRNIISNEAWYGILLSSSSDRNLLSRNVLTNCSTGICVLKSYNNLLTGNCIVESRYSGIQLESAKNNIITRNTLAYSKETGVWLYGSYDNAIYHNNFIYNTIQAYSFDYMPPKNIWDDGCEGNYWSDYNGTDTNGNGVGDSPYYIDSGNIDNYPLMSRWDITPPTTIHNYDGSWHKDDFFIVLIANDDLSGVAETYYRINEGPTRNVGSDGHPIISTEGTNNRLEYWSIDKAGNEEFPYKILSYIKLDKTIPQVSVISPENNSHIKLSSIIIIWNGTDSSSGIEHYEIQLDGSWENVGTQTTYLTQFSDGGHTIKIKAIDKAGNSKTVSLYIIVNTSPIGGPGYFEEHVLAVVTMIVALSISVIKIKRNYYKKIRTPPIK
jgi:parallel beta-helix repeat protein